MAGGAWQPAERSVPAPRRNVETRSPFPRRNIEHPVLTHMPAQASRSDSIVKDGSTTVSENQTLELDALVSLNASTLIAQDIIGRSSGTLKFSLVLTTYRKNRKVTASAERAAMCLGVIKQLVAQASTIILRCVESTPAKGVSEYFPSPDHSYITVPKCLPPRSVSNNVDQSAKYYQNVGELNIDKINLSLITLKSSMAYAKSKTLDLTGNRHEHPIPAEPPLSNMWPVHHQYRFRGAENVLRMANR
ncbi:hypothetical protein CHS0354_017064 [Potamilus streckersoni]|uniref:Uncharacterized protein n=1 Tax=Potamilus streckersoni TaxID=2493646 RepID=A0AAE0S7W2_9BIVA|nr:hypothetical protein CHS0354_017064 [Potamilus streckersoni]